VNFDDNIENEKKRKRLERFGFASDNQNVYFIFSLYKLIEKFTLY
jgi:hypothetical protein